MVSAWRGSAAVVAAGAMLVGAGAAEAMVYLPGYDTYHRELAKDRPVFDSVGQVSIYDQQGNFAGRGSGVLINRRWVLTAAHVVEGDIGTIAFEHGDYGDPYVNTRPNHGFHPLPSPDNYVTGRTYHPARNWYTPKQYNGNLMNGFDIALIDLGTPITGRAPVAKLPPAGRQVGYGRKVDIVGYGTWGAAANTNGGEISSANYEGDYRRAGSNILDGKLSNFVDIYPNPETGPGQPRWLPVANHITAYDFDAGANGDPYFDDGFFRKNDYPILGEVSGAPGDSGGGIFYGDTLVGITSGGYQRQELVTYNTLAFTTEVSAFTNWIRRVILAVQTGDTTKPWLFRQNNGENPLIIDGGDAAANRLGYVRYDLAVPEPTSVMLLAIAGGALLAGRGKRRN